MAGAKGNSLGVGKSLFAAGTVMRAYGQWQDSMAEAEQESQNAQFYREQAEFAEAAGRRQRMIFDRESQVLFGEQMSAFAKNGISTTSSSEFMAREMLYRDQESYAMQKETDMNVKLASMRAQAAEKSASDISNAAPYQVAGTLVSAAASYYGG